MKRIPFKDFVADKGQSEAAAALGVTQGAISKALRLGRSIYVTAHADGTFTAEELRPFPSQAAKPQSEARP